MKLFRNSFNICSSLRKSHNSNRAFEKIFALDTNCWFHHNAIANCIVKRKLFGNSMFEKVGQRNEKKISIFWSKSKRLAKQRFHLKCYQWVINQWSIIIIMTLKRLWLNERNKTLWAKRPVAKKRMHFLCETIHHQILRC